MRFPMKLVGVKEPTSSLKQFLKAAFHLQRKDALETRLGEVTSQGKQFQLNVISGLFWDFFFSNGAFLSLRLFQNSFIFGEASSSHFFRATTSAQQLLFRSSYFFRTAAFFEELLFLEQSFIRSSYFFRVAYFSENLYLTAPS